MSFWQVPFVVDNIAFILLEPRCVQLNLRSASLCPVKSARSLAVILLKAATTALIWSFHLSESVHALLGLQLRVQFTNFVHDFFTLHVAESGRVHCSVQFAPISSFHSAEHLFDSVRGLFQCVICQKNVLYLFVHVLRSVQGVVEGIISIVRLGCGRVRSYFIDYLGSRSFSSIRWCFFLHPIRLFILCNRAHIVCVGSNSS